MTKQLYEIKYTCTVHRSRPIVAGSQEEAEQIADRLAAKKIIDLDDEYSQGSSTTVNVTDVVVAGVAIADLKPMPREYGRPDSYEKRVYLAAEPLSYDENSRYAYYGPFDWDVIEEEDFIYDRTDHQPVAQAIRPDLWVTADGLFHRYLSRSKNS